MGGLVKSGGWRPGRPLLHVRCISLESPDFDNPPIPPTPPTTKRLLFIEYNVVKCFRCIIKNIKEYKRYKKTRFHFMGGLWEG